LTRGKSLQYTFVGMDKALALHRKIGLKKFPEKVVEIIWTHCKIVADICMVVADKFEANGGKNVDREMLFSGALVHDIGAYKCFDKRFIPKKNYMRHQYEGWKILKNEGWDERIANMALRHTPLLDFQLKNLSMKFKEEEIKPQNLEEEILAYADIFHSKGRPRFNEFEQYVSFLDSIDKRCSEIAREYREKFGEFDTKIWEANYLVWHRDVNKWIDDFKVSREI